MRIAIDVRKIGKKSTGSETYFYYLVKNLVELDNKKHRYFLVTDDEVGKIKKILGKLPDNFSVNKVTPTAKLFWTFYSLPRFLKQKKIDLLHTEYTVPFYLRKIKIVTTVHDISFKVNPSWITKKDAYILNSLVPLSVKRADAVIAVSEFTKNEIIKNYRCPEKKIYVTYPAVDERQFVPVNIKEAKTKVKKIIGTKDDYFLHISSLQPRKNVPLVIRAFAMAKEAWHKEKAGNKEIKLVIVGDKNSHNFDSKIELEILKQVREGRISFGDIIITGYQPANILAFFYKAAEAFIFPSSYEGFGIPLIESMASGTPVIASDIEVFREVAGGAADFFKINKKNSAELLADKLKKIIKNKELREEKINLGLRRCKNFSWKNMAKKTLSIYDKQLEKSGS